MRTHEAKETIERIAEVEGVDPYALAVAVVDQLWMSKDIDGPGITTWAARDLVRWPWGEGRTDPPAEGEA